MIQVRKFVKSVGNYPGSPAFTGKKPGWDGDKGFRFGYQGV